MEASGITAKLGREQFMQLLVTQMRNQNPLDPVNNAEFIAQLAQFSTLEGIEKLNTNFSDMLSLQQLTQGANLVGRTAVYQQLDGSTLTRGMVNAVGVQGGQVQLLIQGVPVSLDRVRGILAS